MAGDGNCPKRLLSVSYPPWKPSIKSREVKFKGNTGYCDTFGQKANYFRKKISLLYISNSKNKFAPNSLLVKHENWFCESVLNMTRNFLLITRYFLLVTRCFILVTPCYLLVTRCYLLGTHYVLFVQYYQHYILFTMSH